MREQLIAWAHNPLVAAYVAGIVTGALGWRRLVRFTLGGRP